MDTQMVINSYSGVIFSNTNRKTYWIKLEHTMLNEQRKGQESMCGVTLLTGSSVRTHQN